jgi:hypothetical protein
MNDLTNKEFSAYELPTNVVAGNGSRPPIHGEEIFFSNLFRHLQDQMGESYEQWNFTLHYCQHGKSIEDSIGLYLAPGKRNALLLLADEREHVPQKAIDGFDVVFRQYLNRSRRDERVYPFPVAYQNAAGLAELVPIEQRKTNLFFSGYLNRNRLDLYKQFKKVWWLPRKNLPASRYVRELARRAVEKLCSPRDFSDQYPASIIRFTEWFGKGLPPSEYAAVLADTRIAICPPGFISAETIRHWEAMRLGCVVITAPLPDNPFYKDSPMIIVKDWSQFHLTIKELTSNPERLTQVHEATVAWWRDICCEKSVATYMARVLENHP